MANTFNTAKDAPGIVAKAAAKMLADELQFTKSIETADETDYEGKNGYSSGDTIYISKPARFIPQTTFDITSSIQDVKEEKVALSLDISSTVGVDLSTEQMASEIQVKSVIQRIIKPAVQSIAQNVEKRFLEKATQATYNLVGTAGSTVFDTDTVLAAREKINKFLCPKDDNRFVLFDSTAGRSAVNARKGLFQSAADISKQYKMGYVGTADGFNWLENELLYVHTNGADVACAVEATVLAPATGATTVGLDGVTSGATIEKGSVFTIAGVYAVHPITKQAYPFLQQFTVTADVTETSGNTVTVAISPPIHSAANSLQNVSALHADEAAVVFVGSASTAYTQNLAFHKNAFRKVSVPLVMPKNAEFAAQETYEGITVSIVRDFDIKTRKMITRVDFLGGLVADRPEWACRITG
jgi:hypothetical protein